MSRAEERSTKTVVVAGDLVWDNNLAYSPRAPTAYHEPMDYAVHSHRAGGAWYLRDLVDLACADAEANTLQGRARPAPDAGGRLRISQAYSIWEMQPRTRDSKEQVWRIRQFLGCQLPASTLPPPHLLEDVDRPDVLVLDDLCLGFRDQPDLWPAALRDGGHAGKVVLKTCAPLGQGALWEKLLHDDADRLTVVLSGEALRARGAAIAQVLSWDLAIEDLEREFGEGASAYDLGRCRRVIVHLGCAGVASFSRMRLIFGDPREQGAGQSDPSRVLAKEMTLERFLYHPEELPGSWKVKRPGQTFGATSVLTAAVARHELRPESYPLFIALGRGLAAMRVTHELGGGAAPALQADAAQPGIMSVLHPRWGDQEPAQACGTAFRHDLLADRRLRNPPRFRSDLLQDVAGAGIEYVAAKAADVVLRGPERALQGVPKARYGAYLTVDREEIERINAVRNLIVSYQAMPDDRRPLSIAVFGPPGAGKSFAIKQLAAELFGGKKAILEFNLAQFSSIHDMHEAFQAVRDQSVHGQVPLVFWDEFDASFDGHPLGWLKEFLAPMEDARFEAGGVAHPFGKAIFVFAGGTCAQFEVFNCSDARGKEGENFRWVKGTDFVSRLRGFVNIKGPNPLACGGDVRRALPADELARQDPAHLVRRALLLRSVLERHCRHLIDPRTGSASISNGVVRGFLRVERYLHGARSLEAVVTMSALENARQFAPAALPSPDLLRLHVTPDFAARMGEGELEVPVVEALARSCHEEWRKLREKEGWRWAQERDDDGKLNPLLVAYDRLDEAAKEGNRLPARLTQAMLREIGYRVERAGSGGGAMPRFSDDERGRLMEIEHDIWLRDRLVQGYEWAPATEPRLRLHRDVAPFCAVPEDDKALDGAIVDSIIPTLWREGHTLVRA